MAEGLFAFAGGSGALEVSPLSAVITGASRGIGRAVALALARRGDGIVVNYLSGEKEARAVAGEIEKLGGRAVLAAGDVRDPKTHEELVRRAKAHFGSLDFWVNNAGIARDRLILEMSDAEWEDVVNVNLTGTFFGIRAAAREMAKQKSGQILNIASIVAVRGTIGAANYAAAKAGVIALTKSAAREFGRARVRVNCVLPGFHLTRMGQQVWGKVSERIRSEHLLEEFVDLEELAEFIAFLSRVKTVSGQVFNFDSRVIGGI